MSSLEWLSTNSGLVVNALTGVILAVTALEVYYYTRATVKLTNLTEKQIKITIRPIILVLAINNNLRLKNIGKSPALNITVKDVSRTYSSSNRNDNYVFKITSIPVCGSEEERGAGITPYCNGKPISASGEVGSIIKYSLDYSSLSRGQNYELIIDYEDIENGKWRSISIVDNKGIHFKEVKETV